MDRVAFIQVRIIVTILFKVSLMPDDLLEDLMEVILVLFLIAVAGILLVIFIIIVRGRLSDVACGLGTRGIRRLCGIGSREGIDFDDLPSTVLSRLLLRELFIGTEKLVDHVPIVIQLILRLLDVTVFKSLPHALRDRDFFLRARAVWQSVRRSTGVANR